MRLGWTGDFDGRVRKVRSERSLSIWIFHQMASNDQQDGIKNYEVFDAVGHGGFGKVHRARCLKNGQEVAIKFIEKRKIRDQQMIKRVKSEVEIHSRLKHPYVLEVLNFFEDDVYVYLVLEYCENSDLNSYLKKHTKLVEEEACHFMHQIVKGILYLHKHNIMHRDLKLSNILLTKDLTVKVADFGVATRLENSEEKHFTMCGTPNFLAPEVIMKGPYGLEADVWSVGCMLYSLLVGEPPFSAPDVKNTLNRIVSTGYDLPEELSTEAKDLISSLLQKDGKNRIALEKILEHSFFTKRTSTSLFYLAVNESSADSGRDTLGTTSGELVTCSNPNSSVASSLDSNSNVQPPTPSGANQPLGDGVGSRVRSSTPAFSSPSPKTTAELCQLQPHKSTRIPQLHTPVRQLFTAAKNLQRQGSRQKVQYSNDGHFSSPAPVQNVQQYYGSSYSADRENPVARTCQKQSSLGTHSAAQNQSAKNSGHSVPRHVPPSSSNAAITGPMQNAPKRSVRTDEVFDQNLLIHEAAIYQNSATANSCQFNQDMQSQFLEHDFDDPNRQSPALSEGSLSEEMFNENVKSGPPAFRNMASNSDAEKLWEQQMEVSGGNFHRSVQRHQSENDLYHSDGFYGNHHGSTKRLGVHSPITVKGSMTLQRARHHHHQQQQHQNSLSSVRSRSVGNISQMDDGSGQSGRWLAVSIDVDGEQSSQKMFRAPPLCAFRLRPYTEKKRGAVAHILEDGDVYLEFYKSCGNEERVFEALRISPDGQMISTYHMNVSLDSNLKPRYHAIPSQTFTYSMLPKKYWKKYEYASRFVNALRSVTVKLTLYSDRAKAVLMENSPNQDFEVNFYSGGRFRVKASGTTITQADGTSMILESSSSFTHLSHETQDMWQHVQELHVLCMEFDEYFTEKLSQRMPGFPVVIGRKPPSPIATKHYECAKMDELNAFISGQHHPLPGFSLTSRDPSPCNVVPQTPHPRPSSGSIQEMSSQMSATERQQEALVRNRGVQLKQLKMYKFSQSELKAPSAGAGHSAVHVIKQIHEPNIGTAHEYSNGLVLVSFNNGAKAQLNRTTSQVILKDRSGQCTVFTQNDTLPGKIVSELYVMLGKLGLYAVE